MKHLLLMMAITIVAAPSGAFAQESIDIGGFLLDLPAPGGARGAPAARGTPPPGARGAAANAPSVDRLVRLRDLLKQANAPLATEQEAALNSLLDAEIPNMRRALQARILELQKAKAAAAGPPVQAPPAAAAPSRGGPPGLPPVYLPSPEEVAPDINRLNDQLLAKIGAAPVLKSEQQAIVKKLYRDQIRARGGLDALKLTMDEAGAPFSSEQLSQIQPLFEEQVKARADLAKAASGQPVEKAKVDQLERETLAKVLRLLNPAQRTALLAPKQM
jgi:hypothetical protein